MTKAPEAIPDTVESVSVEWILQNMTDTVEFHVDTLEGWRDLLVSKTWDSSFGPLVQTIMREGFKVPVCMYRPEEYLAWMLGNGHHRMAAAILLCLDEILVYWAPNSEYMQGHTTAPEGLTDGWDYTDNWLVAQMLDF